MVEYCDVNKNSSEIILPLAISMGSSLISISGSDNHIQYSRQSPIDEEEFIV